MVNNFEFASVVFKINSVYSYFHDFAKDYITNKENKEIINIQDKDIDDWIKEHNIDTSLYKREYIETLVIHSKLGEILSSYNTFIFHGSSIYVDNNENGYIFTAPTGTGKSTHVRLLKKNYKDRINYINDDKPFVSLNNNEIFIYGSPFDGKERKSNNIKAKLKGIFIVSRDINNSVSKIKSVNAIEKISNQIHFPVGSKRRENTFNFLFNLLKKVDIYDLKVNISDDASRTSFKIMVG